MEDEIAEKKKNRRTNAGKYSLIFIFVISVYYLVLYILVGAKPDLKTLTPLLISSSIALLITILTWLLRNFPNPELISRKNIIGWSLFIFWVILVCLYQFVSINNIRSRNLLQIPRPLAAVPGDLIFTFIAGLFFGVIYFIIGFLIPKDLNRKIMKSLLISALLVTFGSFGIASFNTSYWTIMFWKEVGVETGTFLIMQFVAGYLFQIMWKTIKPEKYEKVMKNVKVRHEVVEFDEQELMDD